MYVCTYIYMYVRTYVRIYVRTKRTYVHTYVRTTYARTYVRLGPHGLWTITFRGIRSSIHAHKHTYITNIRTYIYTYLHTYVHMRRRALVCHPAAIAVAAVVIVVRPKFIFSRNIPPLPPL